MVEVQRKLVHLIVARKKKKKNMSGSGLKIFFKGMPTMT
jgi:hypothetical protein